jgi:hypothetical protein
MLSRSVRATAEFGRDSLWWHWMNGNISKGAIKLDLE